VKQDFTALSMYYTIMSRGEFLKRVFVPIGRIHAKRL
jgi:hypothetical protein